MTRKRVAGSRKKIPLIIGFDLGGTKLASGVATPDGRVLASRKDKVEFGAGAEGFVDFLGSVAERWTHEYPDAGALGIASCGPLDIKKGVLLQPTNFPKWGTVPVAAPLSRRLGIPVYMHNDAAAAAGVEGWVGGAKELRNWMVLTFGTGLGTGIVMQRKVFMGGSGLGPEAGHIIITDKPYPCGCGNYGCAEAVLSGTGLQRRIDEHAGEWERKFRSKPASPEQLVLAARAGDSVAGAIFEEFSELLARAVHNFSVVFAPEKIFIAGGLAAESDLFIQRTQAVMADFKLMGSGNKLQISVSNVLSGREVLCGAWVARFRALKKN